MNAEHIAGEIKRMYGFREPFDDLSQQTAHTVQFPLGTVRFVPAVDDLVNLVRGRSGRAQRADIDTVTRSILGLFTEGDSI